MKRWSGGAGLGLSIQRLIERYSSLGAWVWPDLLFWWEESVIVEMENFS